MFTEWPFCLLYLIKLTTNIILFSLFAHSWFWSQVPAAPEDWSRRLWPCLRRYVNHRFITSWYFYLYFYPQIHHMCCWTVYYFTKRLNTSFHIYQVAIKYIQDSNAENQLQVSHLVSKPSSPLACKCSSSLWCHMTWPERLVVFRSTLSPLK